MAISAIIIEDIAIGKTIPQGGKKKGVKIIEAIMSTAHPTIEIHTPDLDFKINRMPPINDGTNAKAPIQYNPYMAAPIPYNCWSENLQIKKVITRVPVPPITI